MTLKEVKPVDKPGSLWVADAFWSCFIVFPIMVCYWRGIWDLLGVYIYPDNKVMQCWVVVGIGSGTVLGYAFNVLLDHGLGETHRVRRAVVTLLYMILYALLPMAYWRGVWTTADYYLDQYGWRAGLVEYVICHIILIASRVTRSALISPIVVGMDMKDGLLNPTTRFGVEPTMSWSYVLDAVFSHFIVMTITVLLWRGAWACLSDDLIFPGNATWTDFTFLGIGYALTLTVLLMDPLFLSVSKFLATSQPLGNFNSLLSLAWEDTICVIATWSHILLWRGAWSLNTKYVIPEVQLGGWINHVIGVCGFILTQGYSLVATCGCASDGQITNKTTRFFSFEYFSILLPYLKGRQTCCYKINGKRWSAHENITDGNMNRYEASINTNNKGNDRETAIHDVEQDGQQETMKAVTMLNRAFKGDNVL